MTNATTYTPSYSDGRIPYFYIIKHIPSGKMYAGSKYGKGADPETFMKPGGYQTSSKEVHLLIEKTGIDSFQIVTLKIENQLGMDAYSFESTFLQKWDISSREMWINGHNNTGVMAYGSGLFLDTMKEKYGVSHAMQSEDLSKRLCDNNEKKYGVRYTLQLESVKQKSRETYTKKYGEGITSPNHVKEIRDKQLATLRETYGQDISNPFQSEIVKGKIIQTSLDNYGVSHHMKSQEVVDKMQQTRKGLRERPIVKIIEQYIEFSGKIAKHHGLHCHWKHIGEDMLVRFCSDHGISVNQIT